MTLSYHFTKPSAENTQLWWESVLSNKLSRINIAKLISFLTENENLIKQPPDAPSSSDSDPDFSPSPRPQTYGLRPSRSSLPRTLISPPTTIRHASEGEALNFRGWLFLELFAPFSGRRDCLTQLFPAVRHAKQQQIRKESVLLTNRFHRGLTLRIGELSSSGRGKRTLSVKARNKQIILCGWLFYPKDDRWTLSRCCPTKRHSVVCQRAGVVDSVRCRAEARFVPREDPKKTVQQSFPLRQVIQNESNVDKTLRLALPVGRPTFRLASCMKNMYEVYPQTPIPPFWGC
ncbi:hypothetical protein AVEN_86833-1 [Araneus ventricosus]|uniref:Uncharacterized protein n=1 Tax=Araneus ventricosus TaxID=182803 RepID=A0A4Y2D1H1_ARAVE|nr:hypothetical protein AVEN_86833-1 [Araneus ventricosus]